MKKTKPFLPEGRQKRQFVYLSEDSAATMRAFTRAGERLISVLEEVATIQKEIAESLTANVDFMKKLTVHNRPTKKETSS
jgi:hypothetical protein